ncbi:MAG TPA: cysteine--1-D-myo-inosityl 2-amino-2-deoxy-alpha-D-glucopyranoside ligase [Jiangellaceae bacterium]|nr:cysteine--1-D-myo-inosityl 2-amino-2-deoxy-alpha-D-glucopyranoside ligase [Jiangellaceae bacterium]
MRAWSAPDIAALPGTGLPVRLFDTASASLRATSVGPTARLYVCGITPYDATHLGHAATYIAFDLVNRLWRDAGHEVSYVQNITDVDDPLLERATATGRDWQELAAEQIQLFRDDMTWLRVLPPDHYLGVVESLPLVIELIETLQRRSAVYDVDGDLYFSVHADARFGAVAGLDDATMRTLFGERGGDPDRPGKKDPLDCLLWRQQRPGEPGWDSPFGRGRPGWHVECTALALTHLGNAFDVQGGGSDLAFPHHEMCASEAHVATESWPFARAYVHAGMVGLGGEKMSKSLGNLVLASRLRRDGHEAAAVRLALLSAHYRADREWTTDVLTQASARLAAWRAAASAPAAPEATGLLTTVREHLSDDLDTPAALEAIDRWAEEARLHGGADDTAPQLVRRLADSLLGVLL